MDNPHDSRFLVLPGNHPDAAGAPHPLASCPTYADAWQVRQVLEQSVPGPLVIRSIGHTGGGG